MDGRRETSHEKLDRKVFRLELLTSFCVLVLVVGVAGESATETRRVEFSASRSSDTEPRLIGELLPSRLHGVFQGTVIVSLGAELCCGVGLIFANRKRAAADKLEIRELELKLEELRQTNLNLREQLSPRRLSPSQISALHDFALTIGSHDMDVVIVGGLTETKEYAELITFPFRHAGWRVQFWSAPPQLAQRGISVGIFRGGNLETAEAVSGLRTAFDFAKLNCKTAGLFELELPGTLMGPKPQQMPITHIRMYVGEKEHPKPDSPQ
jgi:hypothetical protein